MSKILYAAGSMEHINNFHLDYIKKLREDGNTVYVMAKGEGADFNIAFEKKMLSFKNLSCQRRIKRILKEEKFDSIILNTTLAAFNIRMVLPKKNRPRVINFVHGYMFPARPRTLKDRIFLFAEKFLRKKTDSIIVMNTEDLTITKKYKLCLGKAYMCLGMGANVPPPELSREEALSHMRCEGKYVITFVGELCRAKNQRLLICALPEIKLHIPEAVLWLIGEGESHRELSELAEKLSVSDSVFFTGRRGNPCDFVRASDLYVSASRKEGLPFNIVEAFGCGKTVVASNIKGHRDLVVEGTTGFLFESDNISDFIEKVLAVHKGALALSEEDILERYKVYSRENVFEPTYLLLKELMKK